MPGTSSAPTNQGRDVLSAILHGCGVSLMIGLAAILLSVTTGVLLGLLATQPSLGTPIRIGNAFLFSGEWWMAIFPALALVILSLSVNLPGDLLRDALNPKLR